MRDDNVIISILIVTFFMGMMMYLITPGQPVIVTGEVVDKMYQASTRTTGTGVGGDGKFIVVSGGNPEKWTVVLKTSEGVKPYIVSPDIYYNVEIGSGVSLECQKILSYCQRMK